MNFSQLSLRLRRLSKTLVSIVQDEWRTFCVATLGTVLMSFALVALIIPYRFAGAGLSGIALLTKYVFDISPAWVLAGGNMLLLLWGWKELSPRFVLWTLYVSLLFSATVAFFELFTYSVIANTLLAAILSGVLGGLGMGMILRFGGSTGGTDVIVAAARKRWGVDMGMFSFYINIAILLMSWFVVDLEQLLLGGVLLYAESITVDGVIKSFDRRKQMTVVTCRVEEVRRFIVDTLERSATLVSGEGAYSGDERTMIVVVLNRRQAMELKRFIVSVDRNAFLIMADVSEVVGEGFKHWKHI
ncbi:YitT family protein [Aminivibrio sp.]